MREFWRRGVVIGCIASALIFAISEARQYVSSSRLVPTPPLPVVEQPVAPEVPVVVVHPEPVRIQNPFDKTEVFEFPAGTSKQAAHDAVAEKLLQRAMERQVHDRSLRLARRRPT